jgi:hypothetical protein
MQRVKAYDLRQKDQKALVDELTKFRVTSLILILIPERTLPAQSQQGFSSSTG